MTATAVTAVDELADSPARPAQSPRPGRFVVLTGSIGNGHVGPARELARRLGMAGHRAEVLDVVTAAPVGIGRVLGCAFHRQLAWAPGTWERIFRVTDRPTNEGGATGGLHRLVVPAVRRLLSTAPVTAVISTFPLAGHAAAAAIRDLGQRIPLVTYLTDPAPHTAWIVPGTERYLTGWAATAARLRRHTTAPVEAVGPLVGPDFGPAASSVSGESRRRWHLPDRPLVLVMSGTWGVGEISATVADLLTDPAGPTPVVVCGRNDRLRRRLAARFPVPVLGWVPQMAELMRACQVAVLNSGGLTLAEANTIGLPVVHYRPLAGQGRANAAFAADAGLARWAQSPQELLAAVRVPARPGPAVGLDPVTRVLAMCGMLAPA